MQMRQRATLAWPIDSPLLREPRNDGAEDQVEDGMADAAPQELQDWSKHVSSCSQSPPMAP